MCFIKSKCNHNVVMATVSETFQDRLAQVYGGVMIEKRQPWDIIGKHNLAGARLIVQRQAAGNDNQARSILRHQMGMYDEPGAAEGDKFGGDAV